MFEPLFSYDSVPMIPFLPPLRHAGDESQANTEADSDLDNLAGQLRAADVAVRKALNFEDVYVGSDGGQSESHDLQRKGCLAPEAFDSIGSCRYR